MKEDQFHEFAIAGDVRERVTGPQASGFITPWIFRQITDMQLQLNRNAQNGVRVGFNGRRKVPTTRQSRYLSCRISCDCGSCAFRPDPLYRLRGFILVDPDSGYGLVLYGGCQRVRADDGINTTPLLHATATPSDSTYILHRDDK